MKKIQIHPEDFESLEDLRNQIGDIEIILTNEQNKKLQSLFPPHARPITRYNGYPVRLLEAFIKNDDKK